MCGCRDGLREMLLLRVVKKKTKWPQMNPDKPRWNTRDFYLRSSGFIWG
jgi:hypothetical protein